MESIIKYGGVALLIFVAIDALWLGLIAKNLYRDQIGTIMYDKPNAFVAVIPYIILILGLNFFVITPAIADGNISFAILGALFFGFVVYSVYNLVNLSILSNWTIAISLIDITWGTILTTTTSLLTYLLYTNLLTP